MKSLMFAVCAVAVVFFPLRAAAQGPAHADSPKVTISVSNPTLVGTTVLKPGDYKFQCRHFDGKSFLVVTEAETGKEVVRVQCQEESLDQKIVDSELRSILRPDGKRVLRSVRIKGETIGHQIVD
jgi:hypothetical protein